MLLVVFLAGCALVVLWLMAAQWLCDRDPALFRERGREDE